MDKKRSSGASSSSDRKKSKANNEESSVDSPASSTTSQQHHSFADTNGTPTFNVIKNSDGGSGASWRPPFTALKEYEIQTDKEKVAQKLRTTHTEIKHAWQNNPIPLQMGVDVIEVPLCGMKSETRREINLLLGRKGLNEAERRVFVDSLLVPVSNMIDDIGNELMVKALDTIEMAAKQPMHANNNAAAGLGSDDSNRELDSGGDFKMADLDSAGGEASSSSRSHSIKIKLTRAGHSATIQGRMVPSTAVAACNHLKEWLKNRLPVFKEKGMGIVCVNPKGIDADTFVEFYLGQLYPPWSWYEKEDASKDVGIELKKKGETHPLHDFYNIMLERPVDDAGYDVFFVDPRYKGTFASRLSHSCDPNCETQTLSFNGELKIATYTIKRLEPGHDMTFNYHSVTESEEEYEQATCLCGSELCKTKFLDYAGSNTFKHIIQKHHSLPDREAALLIACDGKDIKPEEESLLHKHGFRSCLLGNAPVWLKRYAAAILRFIDFERKHLPAALINEDPNVYDDHVAEVEAEGVFLNRIQNLAITINKIEHCLSAVNNYSPPLVYCTASQILKFLWEDKPSAIAKLIEAIKEEKLGVPKAVLKRITDIYNTKLPEDPNRALPKVKKLMLKIRDELRGVPAKKHCLYVAADMIHMYATTHHYFDSTSYGGITSNQERLVLPSDICMDESFLMQMQGNSWPREPKKYGSSYIWGQLMFWNKQTIKQPDCSLSAERRGHSVMPTLESCIGFTLSQRKSILLHWLRTPDREWSPFTPPMQFGHGNVRCFGSPMIDFAVQAALLQERRFYFELKTEQEEEELRKNGASSSSSNNNDNNNDAAAATNSTNDNPMSNNNIDNNTTSPTAVKTEGANGSSNSSSKKKKPNETNNTNSNKNNSSSSSRIKSKKLQLQHDGSDDDDDDDDDDDANENGIIDKDVFSPGNPVIMNDPEAWLDDIIGWQPLNLRLTNKGQMFLKTTVNKYSWH